jgi:peptidoglycan/LPS O-acetylase OafA/YrhL
MLLARRDAPDGILSTRWLVGKVGLALLGIWVFSLAVNANANPVSLFYIAASIGFIISTVILLFTVAAIFSEGPLWNWVAGISYASYFIYLFHRPFWKLIEDAIPVVGLQNQILFRMIPASLIVLILSYLLQRIYDFLLGLIRRQSHGLNLTV